MSKIYAGQTSLRIRVSVHQDITGALNVQIQYRKPDGTIGEWPATVEAADTGVIYHDVVAETELDQTGTWRFWGYVTFADNRSAPGEATKVKIWEVGS